MSLTREEARCSSYKPFVVVLKLKMLCIPLHFKFLSLLEAFLPQPSVH